MNYCSHSGSQPLVGQIPPELVAGILGRSYDATPCVCLPFRSVFSSCPSLFLWFSPSLCFFSYFFFCSGLSSLNLFCYSSLFFFSFLVLFSLSHVLLTLCLLSSRLLSVFSLFFHVLSSSVLPVFFLPLLSLLFFSSLSPLLFPFSLMSVSPLAFTARGCMLLLQKDGYG